jgi:predicted acylesterase/phospholipase RssA
LPLAEDLDALRARVRPFEEAELALVRAVVNLAHWLGEPEENALRYALNLARVTQVRAPDGSDVDLRDFLEPYREEVLSAAVPLLSRSAGVDRPAVARLAPQLGTRAREWRSRIAAGFGPRLPVGALDREVCEKALVLVCGGGGGVGYSYLGGFALLEQFGLTPRLLAGTSMGAILLLFRARRVRYQPGDITEVVQKLSFRSLFRLLQTESRYGLPAALRLYLRAGVGEFLQGPDGHPLALDQLAIPLIVCVTGLRSGALPHDPSYYEHLLDLHGRVPSPSVVKRMVNEALTAVGELIQQRDRFAAIYLGDDEDTRSFDAVDAVGFSSALPGVIHYDVLREDERMHAMLRALFRRHDLFRLVDGGLVDNLPARAAWGHAQQGALGTRNTFVLAFDGFAPKLSQPLWFGLGQLAAQNVARNRPFIHLQKSFQKVLSPLELVPATSRLMQAVQSGKGELVPDMPLIARMCRPFRPVG